jgi:hypothetical protein
MRPHYALFVVVAVMSPATVSAQARIPGWRYTLNITTDSGTGSPRSMATRTLVTANALRTEMLQISNMGDLSDAEGLYTIINVADSTMISVMPAGRLATIMRRPAAPVALSLPKTANHVTRNELQDLGAGERLLGHPTHRYRSTVEGTADVTLDGRMCTRPLNSVTDLWMAEDVDLLPAMKLVLQHHGMSGDAMAQHLSRADRSRMPVKGMPLRMISRHVTLDAAGVQRTITTKMEYVELSAQSLDAGLFQAPEGYRVMDLRNLPRVPQEKLDTVRKAHLPAATSLCH